MDAQRLGGLLLMGLAVAADPCEARGEVLFHEQFSHPDGTVLKPPTPGTQGVAPIPGPGNTWSSAGGSVTPIQVFGGEAVIFQTDGGGNGQDGLAPFTAQATTATTYARFDFRLPSDGNTLNQSVIDEGAGMVALRSDAASGLRARTGIVGPAAGGDFRVGISVDDFDLVGSGVVWATDLDFDVTYRAVIAYNAAEATSTLWLNPQSEASTSITDDSAAAALAIQNFYLRQADDYTGKQFIDNLVVATTFAEALNPPGGGFLEADFDESSAVDDADLARWTLHFGQGTGAMADADGDGDADGADFLKWQEQYGMSSGGGAASVPEPEAALLFGLCVAAASLSRPSARRRSSH
jgi:hypothetical protein